MQSPSFSYLAVALLLFSLNGPQAFAASTSDQQLDARFDSGALRDNLFKLAQDIELSIFFAEETVAGLSVDAVNEQTTVGQLLEAWLTPHCLAADFIREKFVTIARTENCASTQIAEIVIAPPPQAADPPPIMEELLVREVPPTGSRLRQADFSRAMPIDIIDQQEILLSGLQTISELLRYVPAVSGNSTSTLISNGGDGSATITLRGLPASNTLVLLNGRRTNYNALSGDAVNLNTLPLSMVERIEILKDGVSAIYGADAVAGVVNVITKSGHDGFSADIYQGQSAEGDLQTTQFAVQGGYIGDTWHGSINLSAYKQDGIFSRDRSRSESSDDSSQGGINKRSSATVPALVVSPIGTVRLADGASGTSPGDFIPFTSEDLFEYRDYTSSIVPLERYSLYATLGVGDDQPWQHGVDAFLSHTEADTYFAPVPIFTGFESIPLTISAANPFNPFGVDLEDVRRRAVELPTRRKLNTTTSFQFVLHSRYQAERFSFAVALQHDRTEAEEEHTNGIRADRLAESLGGNCSAPCVPVNLLGAPGSLTDEMISYISTDTRTDGRSTLTGLTLDFDWQLGDSDIEIAAGIETRREQLEIDPDYVSANRLNVAGGSRGATRGGRTVVEGYSELYLPLIKGDAMDTLGVQVATRWSQYSDFGSVNNPRVVFNWLPDEHWSFRLSWGKGFRAPTLPQLRGSTLQSFQQLNDPCSTPDPTLIGCTQPSDPSLNQFLTTTGGNRDLKPERSETMTLGSSWRDNSGWLSKQLSLDLFAIDQEDVVDSSAQFIVNRNARNLSFADRIERDTNGNLTAVLATLQNIGSREVKGLDIGARVEAENERWGKLTVALNATHIHSFKDKFDPESPTVDKAGTFSDEASQGLGSLPDWKVSLAASLQHKNWQAHYSIYWISSLEEKIPLSSEFRTIADWTTHSVNVSYFGPATYWIRTTLGVQNLFDATPPFSAAAFNDSYDGRTYDITGRYFYVKLDKAF